ncbi:MAG: SMR family transporter [Pseudomonadota bacterium]|nr:4-amino-4-deoxy-L-arabinose transferase [Gammaproteobacteria bacterium]MBU1558454.1 4-amino-4-deoxy-L-arabinose transferase [Gammaproteobacteria bacterium]MBU1628781.1 4-amino-4-deoxy-L-arabinose transferase [Gammaproteobacteria bacterium]MBU1927173.1 4-amino-4-deoxy-L-arabinose transferase [Gammaproteobacteria bacterium]MBU2545514.1 4-amino-4-deoxy-L-arabinose transferase [Gammaproteobacteria bacterium]
MFNIVVPLVLICMVLNSVAQILLKAAMTRIGVFSFSFQNLVPIGMKVIASPFIWIGMVIYASSVFVWLLVLSRVDVGVAYPLTSIGFILTALAAYFFLGESLSLVRVAGIVVIIAGIYLITR